MEEIEVLDEKAYIEGNILGKIKLLLVKEDSYHLVRIVVEAANRELYQSPREAATSFPPLELIKIFTYSNNRTDVENRVNSLGRGH